MLLVVSCALVASVAKKNLVKEVIEVGLEEVSFSLVVTSIASNMQCAFINKVVRRGRF